MSDAELQVQIEAARGYQSLLVPAMFEAWAVKVADAAELQPGQRVLDVACGTGVLSREVADRVTPTGTVVGLDPGPGMLAVAKELAPTIDWHQGVAESLPFPDDSFDAVVSQFGLMFFTDREKAVAEMLRVLRPGGRLVVAVWDSLENTPAYATSVAILEAEAGRAAADAIAAPFSLGDGSVLWGVFSAAGASSIAISTKPGSAHFPSVATMMEADLRGWLPMVGIVLSDETIVAILAKAEEQLAPYVMLEGGMIFDAPAHIVTATNN